MTRYDIAKFYGYNSPEEYDEAEKRKHKIFTESLKRQKPYVEKEPVKIQSVNQWISVKDRLPDEGASVLICTDEGIRSVSARYGNRFFITIVEAFTEDTVTHWMPLPEPPKDGETNG